jgi:hypothetical protein
MQYAEVTSNWRIRGEQAPLCRFRRLAVGCHGGTGKCIHALFAGRYHAQWCAIPASIAPCKVVY